MKRCYSLKRNKEFRYAYRVGRAAHSGSMVLIYAKGRPGELKIGFSVSKKLGNAVTRNRIKRRLREVVTPLIPDIRTGVKLIVIAKARAAEEKLPVLSAELRRLAKKAGLLTDQSATRTVHGSVCTVQDAVCPVQGAARTVQGPVFAVQGPVCSEQSATRTVHGSVCSEQSATRTVPASVCTVQGPVCSEQSAALMVQGAANANKSDYDLDAREGPMGAER